jgi:hypothetical protein
MANLIVEREYHTEINVGDVISLFNLYNNPHKFFVDHEGVDVRGYKTNYEETFEKIFQSITGAEQQHKAFYDPNYFPNDVWGPFVFRGQEDPEWLLETSLYREYTRLEKGLKKKELFKQEKMMLREFQRQYKRFQTSREIIKNDYYEWFAVMQHHGTPTRFLDFSFSFYVALYFASNNASFCKNGTIKFVIYAINRVWLEKRYKDFLPKDIVDLYKASEGGDSFGKSLPIQEKIINSEDNPFKAVINMNPFNLNSRLVNQKGLFLFPTDLNYSFMENLQVMLTDNDGKNINNKVLTINVELSKIDLISLYLKSGKFSNLSYFGAIYGVLMIQEYPIYSVFLRICDSQVYINNWII